MISTRNVSRSIKLVREPEHDDTIHIGKMKTFIGNDTYWKNENIYWKRYILDNKNIYS